MRRAALLWASLFLLVLVTSSPAQEAPEDESESSIFDDPFAAPIEDPLADPFEDPFGSPSDDPFSDPFAPPSDDPSETGEAAEPGPSLDDSLFAIDDFDSLFGADEIIEDEPDAGIDLDPQSGLLETEGVRWGGRISGSVANDWTWGTIGTSEFSVVDPDSVVTTPSLSTNLFFDARPDSEFRAYGELRIEATTGDGAADLTAAAPGLLPDGFTSEVNEDGDTEIRDADGNLIATIENDDGPTTGQPPGLEVAVDELFADFTWNDTLFFRFGKHTIQWGTGFFFSPADVLNLTAIDAEDPTADREGPVSLRTTYPFGLTGNAYLYLITNAQTEPLDLAIAPKVEFAVGNGELGIGAYYQRALSPRLITLYSASIGEFDVFAEGVLQWGSDRVFVRESDDQSAATAEADDGLDLVVETFEANTGIYGAATAGFRYLRDFEEGPSLLAVAQYFFNGEGYRYTPDLLPAAARLITNPAENGLLVPNPADQPEGYEAPPALGANDLANWGQHYLGATVSLSSLFIDEFSVSLFALVNMSDWSAILSPNASLGFLDRFNLSLAARFTVGPDDGEFTDPADLFVGGDVAPTLGLTLSIGMPGGSF